MSQGKLRQQNMKFFSLVLSFKFSLGIEVHVVPGGGSSLRHIR